MLIKFFDIESEADTYYNPVGMQSVPALGSKVRIDGQQYFVHDVVYETGQPFQYTVTVELFSTINRRHHEAMVELSQLRNK
jgi:hypothetical protein